MAQTRRKSKELDHYLKAIIDKVPSKLDNFIDGQENKMTYYTGNWSTDVTNNFTERQSEKIFKTMSKYMNKPNFYYIWIVLKYTQIQPVNSRPLVILI